MSIIYYVITTAADQQQSIQSVQSMIGLMTISLGSGGAITVAIKQLFDTNRIKIIVELQGDIKGLQREAKYQENNIVKLEAENHRLEAENSDLRNQIDIIQEKCNSSINLQLIDMQEKYKQLESNYRKAVTIIKKSKSANHDPTNH